MFLIDELKESLENFIHDNIIVGIKVYPFVSGSLPLIERVSVSRPWVRQTEVPDTNRKENNGHDRGTVSVVRSGAPLSLFWFLVT